MAYYKLFTSIPLLFELTWCKIVDQIYKIKNMFKSFRGLLKGVGFGIDRNNDRQLGFAHPVGTHSTSSEPDYNSNDDVIVNVYLKDGGVHQVKLVDAQDYIEQNRNNVIQKTHKFRRARLG